MYFYPIEDSDDRLTVREAQDFLANASWDGPLLIRPDVADPIHETDALDGIVTRTPDEWASEDWYRLLESTAIGLGLDAGVVVGLVDEQEYVRLVRIHGPGTRSVLDPDYIQP